MGEEKVTGENLTGTLINSKYRVLKLISQGGSIRMYFVKNESDNKTWVMKAYDKQSGQYFPGIKAILLHESYMLLELEHPAIPKIADIIENDRYIFIVMEYIEGITLNSVLEEKGAQSAERVLDWAKQLCDVLHYLHTLNPPRIYQDMKPHNIMLMPDGKLKLISFGTMQLYDPKKIQDTMLLGTKGYAAPEQFGGMSQSDARTDIFNLGMTMHHLITGVNPSEPPYECKPICQINPKLPRELEYIISKCTKINPQERYQSCKELLDALEGKEKPGTVMLKKLFDGIFKK